MKRYSSKGSIAFVFAAALVAAAAGAFANAPKDDGTMNEAEKAFRAMEEKLAKAKTLECFLEIKCDFGGPMGTETLSYKGLLLLDEGNKARQEIKELRKLWNQALENNGAGKQVEEVLTRLERKYQALAGKTT